MSDQSFLESFLNAVYKFVVSVQMGVIIVGRAMLSTREHEELRA